MDISKQHDISAQLALSDLMASHLSELCSLARAHGLNNIAYYLEMSFAEVEDTRRKLAMDSQN